MGRRRTVQKMTKKKKKKDVNEIEEEPDTQQQSEMKMEACEELGRIHLCDICGSGFKTQALMKRHQRIHSDIKPHACPQCGKAFRTLSRLKGHMRSHTKEKPVKCETCGIGLASTGALLIHKRLHTGEKPHVCCTCQKPFTTKGQLQRHERTHTGDRPYSCTVCSTTFSDTGALKTHMRLHTGEKPFSCDVCGKRFTVKCALKSHYRLHSGERPYICDVCGNAYAASSQLTAHKMRAHLRKKAYSCCVCGVGYTKMKYIKAHMARSHPEHEASSYSVAKKYRQSQLLSDHSDAKMNCTKDSVAQSDPQLETDSLVTPKTFGQNKCLAGDSDGCSKKDEKHSVLFVPVVESLTSGELASSLSESSAMKVLPTNQSSVDQFCPTAASTQSSGGCGGTEFSSIPPSPQLSGAHSDAEWDNVKTAYLHKTARSFPARRVSLLAGHEEVTPPNNLSEPLPSDKPFQLATFAAKPHEDCNGAIWVKATSGISNRDRINSSRQKVHAPNAPTFVNSYIFSNSHSDSTMPSSEKESEKGENTHFGSIVPTIGASEVHNVAKWNTGIQDDHSGIPVPQEFSLDKNSVCGRDREGENWSVMVSGRIKNEEKVTQKSDGLSLKMEEEGGTDWNRCYAMKRSSIAHHNQAEGNGNIGQHSLQDCDTAQSDSMHTEDSDLDDNNADQDISTESNHSKQAEGEFKCNENSVSGTLTDYLQNSDLPKQSGMLGNVDLSEVDESKQNVFGSVLAQASLLVGQLGPKQSQRNSAVKNKNSANDDNGTDENNFSSSSITKPKKQNADSKSMTHKSFLCEICAASFTSKSYLKAHTRSHTGEKPFACQHCPAAFTRSVHLKHHLRSHTGESAYICDICGARLSSSGALVCHKRLHSGDRPFVCSKCQKRFTTSGQLQRHERIHTGQRPYACKLCKSAFADTSALKTHMRLHTGEKPFACEVCEKRFTVKSALTSHARLHTGERPHICSECGEGYPTACGLAAHRNRAHIGKKAFSCPVCGLGYTKTKYVKAHLSRCHPEHG